MKDATRDRKEDPDFTEDYEAQALEDGFGTGVFVDEENDTPSPLDDEAA